MCAHQARARTVETGKWVVTGKTWVTEGGRKRSGAVSHKRRLSEGEVQAWGRAVSGHTDGAEFTGLSRCRNDGQTKGADNI
ncbi:hypothetical protein AG1IA_08747 [Rhizoctonia solani AG-1 IA]|uniref:Uncharacterized protein n=1 Tax=Thanatephorus cucumeris (strain AG1-IA) TaxID=983506 RepID=L8WKD5_THACA|nr:hypothetical protein AG1IA_08747 [Rhizoctonia solani AG-1 IA]